MKCEHCGADIQEETKKDPCWMYKLEGNQVISKLFDPDNIPDGWVDSPKAAKTPKKAEPKKPATKTKKTPKKEVEDGDSTGNN